MRSDTTRSLGWVGAVVFPGAGVEAEVIHDLFSSASLILRNDSYYNMYAAASATPPQDLLRSFQSHGPVKTLGNRAEYKGYGIANLAFSVYFKIYGNTNKV